MLSLFRTNQIFANVLLIIYALLLRLSLFFVPVETSTSTAGVWSDWVFQKFDPTSIGSIIITVLLVSFQATCINYMITKYRMANEISLFPGAFYILFCSMLPDFLYLSPILLGNTFLIFALLQLMDTYKEYSSADNIYNVGLWIGVASLFYFSFSIFLILGWAGLNVLRAFKFKERLMLITGFLSPYLIAFTYHYWYDNADYFWQHQVMENISFLNFEPTNALTLYIGLGLTALLILIILASTRTYNLKKNIGVQKNITILYLFLLISLFTLLFQANIAINHLLILAIPIGIFISFNFTNMSNRLAESLHLILLTIILVYQFIPLIAL